MEAIASHRGNRVAAATAVSEASPHASGSRRLDHVDGILNYCRTSVRMGVVEAVNGSIKSLLRRGRGYKNLHYLLLKARRIAATKTEFVAFKKAA